MRSVSHWLVVFSSLVAATEAIKCLCDKTLCLDAAAEKEEECLSRLDKDYFVKNPSKMKELEEQLPMAFYTRDSLRRQSKGEPQSTKGELKLQMATWITDAEDLMIKLSIEKKIRLGESLNEIISHMSEISRNTEKKDYNAIVTMMDQAFAGTYAPKQVDYNFCIKKIDGNGTLSRSCGLKGVDSIGTEMKVGCHNNTLYQPMVNDYPKYCRCDTDMCNSGDGIANEEKANESSSSTKSSILLEGFIMRVCFSVVMSQICRV